MGALIYLRQRPDDRCRLLATVIPAFIVYVLFSLEGFRGRECPPTPHSLAPLLSSISPTSSEKLAKVRADKYVGKREEKEATKIFPPPGLMAPSALHLPQCAADGRQAKTFLLVFMGHSGSSAIISELAAHSQVYFEHAEPVDHHIYEHNTTLSLEWTRNFFERGIAAGKTPGFKLRPTHIYRNPRAWAELAREYDTRIVWQYRDNIFKKTVGEYTYRYLNDSSVVEGLRRKISRSERCHIGAGCRFRIDNFRFFHNLLRDSVKSDKEISGAVHAIVGGRDCVHALPYEDYLYARTAAMRRLHMFLGIRPEDHKPDRHKATSDNLCDAVSNWAELCANFYGCHAWRWQMDDPRNGCHCNFSSGSVKYCSADLPADSSDL